MLPKVPQSSLGILRVPQEQNSTTLGTGFRIWKSHQPFHCDTFPCKADNFRYVLLAGCFKQRKFWLNMDYTQRVGEKAMFPSKIFWICIRFSKNLWCVSNITNFWRVVGIDFQEKETPPEISVPSYRTYEAQNLTLDSWCLTCCLTW